MIRQTNVAAIGLAFMLAASCVGANAQTSTALAAGGIIQTDGWKIDITTCSFTPLGGSSTSCSPGGSGNLPSGDALQAITSTHGAAFEVINTGGGPVLSITSTTTAFEADINYTLLITPISSPSTLTLDSISAAVSGTTSSSNQYLSDISAGLAVTTASGTLNFTSYATGTTTGPVTFAPASSVIASYDLKLNAGTTPSVTLNLINQPTNAPEPATLAIFGPAMLAMATMRRSRQSKRALLPAAR